MIWLLDQILHPPPLIFLRLSLVIADAMRAVVGLNGEALEPLGRHGAGLVEVLAVVAPGDYMV